MDKSTTMGTYKRLWHGWYRHRWKGVAGVFLLMLIVATMSALYSKGIEYITTAMQEGRYSVMYWGPLVVMALVVVKSGAQYGSLQLSNRIVGGVGKELRQEMFASLVDADLARLAQAPAAAQAARFSAEIGLIDGATRTAIKGATAVLTIIVTFLVMLTIDWSLTLILFAVFTLALLPVNLIGRRVRNISRETQTEVGHMTSGITESLSGIRLARTYQLEEPLKQQATQQFDRLYKLMLRMVNWDARITPLMEVLAGSAVAVLFFVVGWRMTKGTITLAEFMALLTGLGVATNPARRLGNTYATMQQGRVALERVFELFDAPNSVVDKPDAKRMEHAKGDLTFRDVEFAYPDGTPALKDFSLNVPAGTKVALVGRSGAGKTTVFNLLPRLYDPVAGQITLDGMDLRDIRIADLRRQIAVVSQETVLLSATVAENIGYGRPDHTSDDVEEAAKAAAAHDFVAELPEGYDTPVGPGGATFSGGQRQRLSIARAILRKAPILLLDEPTSALDAESEALIKAALDQLSEGRTTFIIAHRLSTVLDADMIVVMDKGQIVDTGPHAELLKRGGLYADLYALQFAD